MVWFSRFLLWSLLHMSPCLAARPAQRPRHPPHPGPLTVRAQPGDPPDVGEGHPLDHLHTRLHPAQLVLRDSIFPQKVDNWPQIILPEVLEVPRPWPVVVSLAHVVVRHVVTAVVPQEVALPHHPHHRRLVDAAVPLGVVYLRQLSLTSANPEAIHEKCSGAA